MKLSLDGKKIAVSYSELGEEDLGGLEQPPMLTVHKKLQLENLKKKVEGNWIFIQFAPSISFFLHTTIAVCKTSITDLLSSIDKLASVCACLSYISSSSSAVSLREIDCHGAPFFHVSTLTIDA